MRRNDFAGFRHDKKMKDKDRNGFLHIQWVIDNWTANHYSDENMKPIPLVEPGLLNQSIRAVGTPLFILLGVGEMAVSSFANIL